MVIPRPMVQIRPLRLSFSDYTETKAYEQVYRYLWEYSSVAEHGIADPAVTGSTPVAPLFSRSVHL